MSLYLFGQINCTHSIHEVHWVPIAGRFQGPDSRTRAQRALASSPWRPKQSVFCPVVSPYYNYNDYAAVAALAGASFQNVANMTRRPDRRVQRDLYVP